MSSFEKCDQPAPVELAKNNPVGAYNEADVHNEATYWLERSQRDDTIGDMALASLASDLHWLLSTEDRDTLPQPIRTQYDISLLGQSKLWRFLFDREKMDEYNLLGNQAMNVIPEQGYFSHGRVVDPRVHAEKAFIDRQVMPDNGNTPETWYQAGDLYLRRTQTAEVSPAFRAELQANAPEMLPGLIRLESLFPYLARR